MFGRKKPKKKPVKKAAKAVKKPKAAKASRPVRRRLPRKFDIFLSGVEGLGVLTLARIIAEAALKEGMDVKTEEFHGLAQRYGALHTHIRMGRDIDSAMIPAGQSDLIIGLEPLEALRAAYYGSEDAGTIFLVNTEKIYPLTCFVEGGNYPPLQNILNHLNKFSKKVYSLNVSKAVKEKTGSTISTNIYMLGMASGLGKLPISRKSILWALSEVLRKRFVEQNIKIFQMGEKAAKSLA